MIERHVHKKGLSVIISVLIPNSQMESLLREQQTEMANIKRHTIRSKAICDTTNQSVSESKDEEEMRGHKAWKQHTWKHPTHQVWFDWLRLFVLCTSNRMFCFQWMAFGCSVHISSFKWDFTRVFFLFQFWNLVKLLWFLLPFPQFVSKAFYQFLSLLCSLSFSSSLLSLHRLFFYVSHVLYVYFSFL